GRYENGIIVYFPSHQDNSLAPGAFAGGGSGGEETKMEAGIYWFWRKIRSSAALRRKLMEQEGQTNPISDPGMPVGSPTNR
ncbi:MAG TPA: hypothetical protein VK968_01460, partial [Roseimicrobium sp.]|nr:hypothetical protein [Roseimicrobium sp.]